VKTKIKFIPPIISMEVLWLVVLMLSFIFYRLGWFNNILGFINRLINPTIVTTNGIYIRDNVNKKVYSDFFGYSLVVPCKKLWSPTKRYFMKTISFNCLQECTTVLSLNHPNLHQVQTWCLADSACRTYIIPSYPCLFEFVEKEFFLKNKSIPVEMLMDFISQILDGLSYLHSNNLRIEEFTPKNILIAGKRVLLTNYANFTLFGDDVDGCDPNLFVQHRKKYSKKQMEMHSLACIIFGMMSNMGMKVNEYRFGKDDEVYEDESVKDEILRDYKQYGQSLIELLLQMLHPEKSKKLKLSQIQEKLKL
jgi:serine/threonine protein kinase